MGETGDEVGSGKAECGRWAEGEKVRRWEGEKVRRFEGKKVREDRKCLWGPADISMLPTIDFRPSTVHLTPDIRGQRTDFRKQIFWIQIPIFNAPCSVRCAMPIISNHSFSASQLPNFSASHLLTFSPSHLLMSSAFRLPPSHLHFPSLYKPGIRCYFRLILARRSG